VGLLYKQKKIMKQLLIAILGLLLFSSCKKERQETIVRSLNVSGYNKLNLSGNYEVIVHKGSAFSVRVLGRDKDINELKAEVLGGELRLVYNTIRPDRDRVNVTITMPSLIGFKFAGKCLVDVNGFSENSEVTGTMSENTKGTINISAPKLALDVSGNAELILKGNAETVEITGSDQAIFNSYDVPAKMGLAIASGSASLKIFTSIVINAAANHNSRIFYKGNPGSQFLAESENAKIIAE
jgi:hypothetical protein